MIPIDYVDDRSMASLITWESMVQKQNKISNRLDNIDAILSQILGAIRSGSASNRTQEDENTETGLNKRSGEEA